MSRTRVATLVAIVGGALACAAPADARGPAPAITALGPSTPLTVSATPGTVKVGRQLQVSVTLTDDDPRGLGAGRLRLTVPKRWTLTGSRGTDRSFGSLRGHHSLHAQFTLQAPATAAPLTTVDIRASATFVSPGGSGRAADMSPVTLVSPITNPFETVNATGQPASFGQSDTDFSIDAAGTGISTPVTTGPGTAAASDSYAAVLSPAGAPGTSVAQVTVAAQEGSRSGPEGAAGLLERNTFLVPSSPEGVALSVSTSGTIRLAYNTGGGPFVNAIKEVLADARPPVTLRLARTGATYAGAFSTDGGRSWTSVGTATVAATAAADPQDLALFHASGVAGSPTRADFTDFSVH